MFLIPDTVPYWLPTLKILISSQLNIPGLHTIGYYNYKAATHRLHNHYHKMAEFTVIIKGTQQFWADNTPYTLQGGDIFSTRPYECHGNNGNFQQVCEYVWFQLDLSDPDGNFLGLAAPQGKYLYQQINDYPYRIKTANNNDLLLLKKAFFLLADTSPIQKMKGQNYLISFILNNLCEQDSTLETDQTPSFMQEAIRYIQEHLYEDIDIQSIAAHVGLSASRFQIRFKTEFGITPHTFITIKRIEVAKDLLKDPNYTVTEVAYLLNFSSSNHFSTVFKKQTGMTPTQYHKSYLSSQQEEQ